MNCLPGRDASALHILGSSTKVEKGEGLGVLTAVAYLAPADASGRQVCPKSTAACRAGCLGVWSGRMRMRPVRDAQLWKTALRFGAPGWFFELLRFEIRAHEARANRLRLLPAVRLDGTSDLGDGLRMAPEFPRVRFYDYTKRPAHAIRALSGRVPNYHATLSFSGENRAACVAFLRAGGNVAVPFDCAPGEPLPDLWEGFPVVNADESDWRPGDPPGSVAGLAWKGPRATREAAVRAGWAQPID